ncbi:MAG: DeoR/GlpR transcriptional regulator [Pirellulales bacterium]|nr:DeoR/GlpR transcriptional regulator [Pirellulales bacterium]
MLASERRNRLLELVRVKRFASLPELIEELQVSESTVRRDLEHLEQQGSARRIHGGVLYAGTSPKLPHFDEQEPGAWAKKRAIARRAAALVEDGDTILLDGGSTTYELARLLVGRPIHVVTTSLPVANLFAADPASDLILVGGNICPRSGVAQGPLAGAMIASLRVRKTIFSVAGINDEGFFNNNLLLVETERAMMRAADEVVVVADSSKLGRRSLTHLCGLDEVQHLVVDDGIPQAWQEKIAAAGVALVVAPSANDPEA